MPAITPFGFFEDSFYRAQHLVDIYDLLLNQRKRKPPKKWFESIAPHFRWPKGENICRVDGNGAVLLIREEYDWEMSHFDHEWLGELLRAGLVFAVAAFDRYIHDLVMDRFIQAVGRDLKDMPKLLRKFKLPLSVVEECLRSSLSSRSSGINTRPRTILKTRFRKALREKTFQRPQRVEEAFGLLGVGKIWNEIAAKMNAKPENIKSKLDQIAKRRNKNVHEADVLQKERPQSIHLRDIDSNTVQEEMDWIYSLAEAIDGVVYGIEENGSDE